MSNSFTNFLNGALSGFLNSPADLKDYQHANRLYVRNTYARAPKVGFLYFVNFNINGEYVRDIQYRTRDLRSVGLLVKKIDLPKFKISTETLNQYNRKTVVQTKLTYEPIKIDFHDDNSDITLNLWKNYFNYYYADGVYGTTSDTKTKPKEFRDTKYANDDNAYGLDNYQEKDFFESIDIYVLHRGHGPQDFTQYTLINPKIQDWTQDTLDQNDSTRVLTNSMSVAYETVQHRSGKIVKNDKPEGFTPVYYDTQPSPLQVGGGIPGTLTGVLGGASDIFGANGSLANARSPLDYLGVALQIRNLGLGASQLNRAGLRTEGYSILGGVLGGIAGGGQQQFTQPGGVVASTQQGLTQSGFGALGNIGVNLFSYRNSSINNSTVGTLRNILTPPGR